MKNIHLIPTDKPSRLQLNVNTKTLILFNNIQSNNESAHLTTQNIFITSDEEVNKTDYVIVSCSEAEIEEVNLVTEYYNEQFLFDDRTQIHMDYCRKIILTTDPELIADGVQSIDDEFLEWYIKNPSCEVVSIDKNWNYPLDKSWEYKIMIPKEEPKQITSLDGDGLGGIPKGILTMLIGKKEETLEEYVLIQSSIDGEVIWGTKQETLEEAGVAYAKTVNQNHTSHMLGFLNGAKWQQERMYSEEEVLEILDHHTSYLETFIYQYIDRQDMEVNEDWFEQFKK